jgi:hypothetical protein
MLNIAKRSKSLQKSNLECRSRKLSFATLRQFAVNMLGFDCQLYLFGEFSNFMVAHWSLIGVR